MSDALQAAVDDKTNVVVGVYVMDQPTVELFRELGFLDQLWPGCTLYDVTDPPRPGGPGWTYNPDTSTVWRPPQPSPAAIWNDDQGAWVEPVTDPEPAPEPAAQA